MKLPMNQAFAALCVYAMAGAHAAIAAEPLPPVDKAYVGAGVYGVEDRLSGRWDSSTLRGTSFNVERDLGFDTRENTSVWALGAAFGASRQHKLDLVGYRYSDNGQRTLTSNLLINGNVYPIGGNFSGSLDVGVIAASYTWMFYRTDRQAAGLGLGLVQYDFDASLAVETIAAGLPVRTVNALGSKAVAPLLSAEYVRSLGNGWRVGTGVSYVRADRDGVDGEAIDAHVRTEWFPWEHVGFGLRYNYNEIDLDFDRRQFKGNLDVRNQGFQFFVMARY